MEATKMRETLTQRATEIRDELLELEKTFNQKKEQFLKLTGALEALDQLDTDVPSTATE
jgi:hypothetical protein|tara:strand:+ start:1524 stop:1700 length:177 start_codon:yes stop_codon:yes gene_type:complete